jgi:S1-C subfamily serine protease
MKSVSAYFGLGCLLFFSCRSIPPAPPPVRTLEEITVAEIQNLIQSEEPTKALQWVLELKNSSFSLDEEHLERLEIEAKAKLLEKFSQAIESSDFTHALSLYISYSNVYDSEALSPYSEDQLKFLTAEEERKKGNSVLALSYFLEIKERSLVSPEGLEDYLRISIELRNYSAARSLLQELEKRNVPIPADLSEAATQRVPLSDYLGGTVTIWVNRGIRMEQGVGIPDRVIGSGFYIDPRGYLLTNYHVISSEVDPTYEGYSRLYIRPSGRSDERIPAKVVGYDRIFDIALLKAEVKPPFLFGITDVQELKVGSRIYALGSPGGLENTMTSGIVSAVGRRFFQMGDALQMDVPVNPGSSGGPLIDEEGRLIGIVFAGIRAVPGGKFCYSCLLDTKNITEDLQRRRGYSLAGWEFPCRKPVPIWKSSMWFRDLPLTK